MNNRSATVYLTLTITGASVALGTTAEGAPFESSVAQVLASRLPPEQTRHRLPKNPALAWQARLQGSITYPPAVSDGGDLVIASTGRLSQLDSEGKLAWSFRVRGASAAARPVIVPTAHRVLVTSRAELLVLDARGSLTARADLPVPTGSQLVGPVPTAESTLVLAFGRSLVLCDLRGKVLAATQSSGVVADLSVSREKIWVTTRDGRVERWIPGVDLRQMGELGGIASAVQLDRATRLVGVVDQKRLVELDLRRGKRRVLADVENLGISGAPIIEPSTGTVHLTTNDGLLVSFTRNGTESRRVLLSPTAGTATTVSGTPRLLRGRNGQVGFVLPTGDLGVVDTNGSVSRAGTSSCRAPVAIVSTRNDQLAVACGSGLVMGYRSDHDSRHQSTGAAAL
jgi:hypothetical protein